MKHVVAEGCKDCPLLDVLQCAFKRQVRGQPTYGRVWDKKSGVFKGCRLQRGPLVLTVTLRAQKEKVKS